MQHLSHPAHHQRDTLIRARDDRRCRVTDERSNRRLNYRNDNFGARLRTHFYIYTYLYTYTTVGKKTTSNGSYLSTTAYTNEYSTLRASKRHNEIKKKKKEKKKRKRKRKEREEQKNNKPLIRSQGSER